MTAGLPALSGLFTCLLYNEWQNDQVYYQACQTAEDTVKTLIQEGKISVPANRFLSQFIGEVIRVGVHGKNILTDSLDADTIKIIATRTCSYTPVFAMFSYLFSALSLCDLAQDAKQSINKYFSPPQTEENIE